MEVVISSKRWCLVLLITFATAWISYLTSNFLRNGQNRLNTTDVDSFLPSSVWCHSGPSGERLCRFRNICYDPWFHEFQFMLTEESVLSGVQSAELWKNIDMSTVLEHNAFKMKVSLMSNLNRNKKKSFRFQEVTTFIIHRFKPDNIMHVIHDDLIPLYFTIESVLEKTAINTRQFSLAFSDNYNESLLNEWYSHFSSSPIISLPYVDETVCFHNAFVGLHRATLWFNYGFKNPQGPYLNNNFNVNGIRNFVQFNLKAWKVKSASVCSSDSYCNKIVIVIRSESRQILNLDVLIEAVEKAHGKVYPNHKIVIVKIDFARHDPSFILSHLQQAKLIVGMHGAGMILSIFLPPKSGVVEMFPYAINPDNVSFLKALLQQHQSYPFHYESWQNQVRGNSIPGSNADPLMGGISHLPEAVQNQIKSLSEVPPVKCCHDPAYLFYIYHSTNVTEDVFHPILHAFAKMKTNTSETESVLSKHVFPSLPSFVKCSITETGVSVDWGEVSNSEENEDLWFQITLQSQGHVKVVNVTNTPPPPKMLSVKLAASVQSIQLWFQPFNEKNIPGHIKYENCLRPT